MHCSMKYDTIFYYCDLTTIRCHGFPSLKQVSKYKNNDWICESHSIFFRAPSVCLLLIHVVTFTHAPDTLT